MTEIKNLLYTIKEHITLEHCVIRFIMAWCFMSLCMALDVKDSSGELINNLDFVGQVRFLTMIVLVLGIFMVFYIFLELVQSMIHRPILDKVALLVITFLYAMMCVIQENNIYFVCGMIGLMIFSVMYCAKDTDIRLININRKIYIVLIVVSGLFYVGFTGCCMVAKVLSYASPNFDMGLFSQMFHYMKTTLTMNTTSERDMLLSHMCVHISPAFYLLLPFYAIWSSPVLLEIMQPIVIILGLIPLTGICRNHNLSRLETVLICVCYSFYSVMSGGCFYDVHENMFLPVFILTLLYFVERNNLWGMVISAIMVFSVKEDASIYVAFIAIYIIFAGKNAHTKENELSTSSTRLKTRTRGGLLLVMSVGYFVFTTVLLSKLGDGVMTFRYNNMIYGGNGSMIGIIRTVFTNPAYIVTQIFDESKIEFMLQTLVPLAFMPFVTRKWRRLVLIGPYVMFNLMSDYTYFHSIMFQYAFGSGTLLFYLAVINVSDINIKKKSVVVPMLAISSMLIFFSVMWKETAVVSDYFNSYNKTKIEYIDEALDLIPDDATVTASTFLCPALSNRDILYEKYYTDETTEYIALDLRVSTTDYNVNYYLKNDRYEEVYYKGFVIAVFRDKEYVSNIQK